MADIKFTSLEIYNDDLSIEDKFPIVDISDNSMGSSGTNKIIGADRVSRSVALLMPNNILNGSKLVDNSLSSDKLSVGSPTWSANSNINIGYETSNVDLTLNIGQNRTPDGKTSIRIFSNNGLNPTSSIVKDSGNNSLLTFTNDGSGGMLFNQTGAGNIELKTNGNERMRITPDGNVGIGTSSPTTPLQVVGTITAGNLNVASTVTAANVTVTGSNIVFEGLIADDWETTLTVANPTADNIITLPNATGTVVLSGAIGNIDINSSAAISDTKLATISTSGKVSNSATTATSANIDNTIVLRGTSGNFSAGTITANLSGNASTATTLATPRTIAISGAVTGTATSFSGGSDITIATNITDGTIVNADINASAAIAGTKISPDFGNQNISTTRTASDFNSLDLTNTSGVRVSLNANGNSEGNLRTVTNHPLTLSTNNTERMRITASGNVGIGTNSAGGKLDVAGTTSRIRWQLDTAKVTSIATNAAASAYAEHYFDAGSYTFNTSSAEIMRITASGNVGIGTSSPVAPLHVQGQSVTNADPELAITGSSGYINFHNSLTPGSYNGIVASGDKSIIFSDGSSGTGAFVIAPWAANASGIRINSSGNVGICKSSPSTALDVNGTVTATAFSGPLTGNVTGTASGNTRDLGTGAIKPNATATCTTTEFVTAVRTLGAFLQRTAVYRCTWDYAGNAEISDTGFGELELAGCIIETFTDTPQANNTILPTTYHIRVTSPNSGAGAGGIHEYNNHGGVYNPGWRRVYTSSLNGNISGNAATVTAGVYTNAANVITGSLGFGSGTNTISSGTGDNATLSTYNLAIKSWWGIGFPSYDNVNRIVLDTRTGGAQFSGTIYAPTFTGNAATATNLSTNSSNWSTYGTISAVVGQLGWKNFGNGHTIFDASQGTSPTGTAKNNTNPEINWSATYPTLMGWNGVNTYGVRVDTARLSESCSGNAATATTAASCSGNSATATLATKASTLSNGGGDGFAMTFNWTPGTGTQPTWLWGGNNGSDMYVYDPVNFSVNYASNAGSATTVSNGAVTAAKLDGNQSGSAPIYGARAWVNFNGTETVTIRNSGNVSSITDNDTGNYTVNFATAMQDADFSTVVTSGRNSGNADLCQTIVPPGSGAGVQILLSQTDTSSLRRDSSIVCVAVFR